MALRPLEVDVQMRHDWTSAPAMHDDEVAQLTAEIERLRAEIRDLSRSTS